MLLRNASRLFRGLHTHPDVPVVQDVLKGAFLGDFANRLGLPGAATQVTLSMVPVIGDFAIMRDIVADMGRRDDVDIALNIIALTPFLGGIAKTAEVVRNARRVGQTLHIFPEPHDYVDGDGIGPAR
jgi:hypothetical protein